MSRVFFFRLSVAVETPRNTGTTYLEIYTYIVILKCNVRSGKSGILIVIY